GSDIKDPRFFGTIAAVPILHLLSVWLRPTARLHWWDYAALAMQAIIVALVIHVRAATAWSLVALVVCWIFLLGWHRRGLRRSLSVALNWRWPRSLYGLAMYLLAVTAFQYGTVLSLHSVYQRDHAYAHHNLSHGLLYSLQFHPEWESRYLASVNGQWDD